MRIDAHQHFWRYNAPEYGWIDDSMACLLELTRRGTEPFRLPNGEERRYLEDGDEVILRGYCEREGAVRIGFGECRGRVTAAAPI